MTYIQQPMFTASGSIDGADGLDFGTDVGGEMLFDSGYWGDRGGGGGSERAVRGGGVGSGGIRGGAWLETGGSEQWNIELEHAQFGRFTRFDRDLDGFGGVGESRDAASYDAYYDALEEGRSVRIAQMDTKDPKEFEEVSTSCVVCRVSCVVCRASCVVRLASCSVLKQ
jgi:hypothetical protein